MALLSAVLGGGLGYGSWDINQPSLPPTWRALPRLASFDVCSRNGRQARPVARVVGEQAHGAEVRAGVRGGRRVVCFVDLGVRRLTLRPLCNAPCCPGLPALTLGGCSFQFGMPTTGTALSADHLPLK
jgi:hypothetical protein